MGAPDKVTRLLLTLPYVTVDCLCKCDPKPECLILSGTSFKTSLRVNSWDISNVCLKCDPGLGHMHGSRRVIKWFLIMRIHVDKQNSSKKLMASEVPKMSVHKSIEF